MFTFSVPIITIKFTNEGTVRVTAVQDSKESVVSITDTGPGIDCEILPRLFTKFATKSTNSTGLGLFISKSIIDAHGGVEIIILNVKELRLDLVCVCIMSFEVRRFAYK